MSDLGFGKLVGNDHSGPESDEAMAMDWRICLKHDREPE
jgi:hypothetical protein